MYHLKEARRDLNQKIDVLFRLGENSSELFPFAENPNELARECFVDFGNLGWHHHIPLLVHLRSEHAPSVHRSIECAFMPFSPRLLCWIIEEVAAVLAFPCLVENDFGAVRSALLRPIANGHLINGALIGR